MKKALLIGIDYVNIPKVFLRGCINDIINTRNMLIDAYDYESKNITIIRDDDPGKFISPTREKILGEFSKLCRESENLEEIWLHYSGHGSQIQITDSKISIKERDGLNEILIPVDYETEGCIFDYELLSIIQTIKCRAILIFDCCHSGTICDIPWVFEVDTYGNINKTNVNNNLIFDNSNVFVLSACKDSQSSADTRNYLDQSVGAFSNAILECLRNSHHNIDIIDLYKNVSVYLKENNYSQTPIMSSTTENSNFKFMN